MFCIFIVEHFSMLTGMQYAVLEISCLTLLFLPRGVGGHGGIGKLGDSESRFRDILDRVSKCIAGYVDAPMPVVPRYLQLPDIFSPNHEVQPTMMAHSPTLRTQPSFEAVASTSAENQPPPGPEAVVQVCHFYTSSPNNTTSPFFRVDKLRS